MPYKDPEKRRAAQRKSYHKNKHKRTEEMNLASKERRQKEREERDAMLSVFPCLTCGCNDPNVIEWHHVYPEDKVFGIKEGASYARERWWDEVMKCVPLCCNCHTKLHKNLLCLISPIGFKPL